MVKTTITLILVFILVTMIQIPPHKDKAHTKFFVTPVTERQQSYTHTHTHTHLYKIIAYRYQTGR